MNTEGRCPERGSHQGLAALCAIVTLLGKSSTDRIPTLGAQEPVPIRITVSVVTIVATYEGVAGLSVITVTEVGGVSDCWPWDPTNVNPCATEIPAPQGALAIAGAGTYVYDTHNGVLTSPAGTTITPAPMSTVIQQAGGTLLRVVSVRSLDVGPAATLRVRGNLPLVLLVHGVGTVSGTIDASAVGSLPGPGGDELLHCSTGFGAVGVGSATSSAPGGGGGGGYGTRGGYGGAGFGGNPGGPRGSEGGSGNLAPLRGGCAGGRGGSRLGIPGGAPGGGGGAVQIVVRELLTVTGTVRSAGGGGNGVLATGGGGGGAGGSLLLEANAFNIGANARLCANGGSGGEGGNNSGSSPPVGQGVEGTCSATAAVTPDRLPDGGNGGLGGYSLVLPTSGENGLQSPGSGGAGGGGGGGGGRVRVRGVTSRVINAGAVVTPPALP